MTRKETLRRYLLFGIALFINSLGISIITKAMLGTSSISSVPFVLSLFTPFTMGIYTIVWNILFVFLERPMMTRREVKEHRIEYLSQVPVGICLGVFIDISMTILWWLNPQTYVTQIISLLVGCIVLGIGVSLEVKANVAMAAGEYFVQVISRYVHKEFGFVKVFFDIAMVATAVALSFIFMGHLAGVREGTVISALLVGPVSHFVYPQWRRFDKWLNCGINPAKEPAALTNQPMVITITREYGSGGRLLGKALADALGVKFYDKELISMVADDLRKSENFVASNEQRLPSSTLLDLILQDYEAPLERSLCSYDALFVSQSRVIRKLAQQEPCVIVGRCADFILSDFPQATQLRIFCYTDIGDASRRCVNAYNEPAANIEARIKEANRSRIAHYQHYTGRKWGDPHYYDLMVNTGTMTVDTACTLVAKLYREKQQHLAVKA